ncbi:MAG: cytochrome c family protein [Sphingomonas sp.]|jgi:cytochrome c
MDIRTNTIAGWALAACGTALALSIVTSNYFKAHRPEKMGYPIEGVEEAAEGGTAAAPDKPISEMMADAVPSKGEQVFKKCAACHTAAQGGANGIGPNLWATAGAPIAQGKAGYVFSDVLKAKGGTWTFENLNDWLKNPRKFAEGTKMTFAGLPKAEDRADVIAYLNAQGSGLPIPAASAVSAPTTDDAAAPAADNAAAPAAPAK